MPKQSPTAPNLAQIFENRRWSRADASIVVESWRASGPSRSAFCERHGLDGQRLDRWAKQLPSAPAMAEVFVIDQPTRQQSVVVVKLGAARVVVDDDVDDAHLARVLRVVGSVC